MKGPMACFSMFFGCSSEGKAVICQLEGEQFDLLQGPAPPYISTLKSFIGDLKKLI